MQLLIRSVMILVMLLHGICGCCWHHTHDACCNSSELGISLVTEQCAAACCHNSRCPEPSSYSGEVSELPCEPEEACSEVECVYVGARTVDVSPAVFLTLATEWDVYLTVQVCQVDRRIEVAPTPLKCLSAAESCALLQVWRI